LIRIQMIFPDNSRHPVPPNYTKHLPGPTSKILCLGLVTTNDSDHLYSFSVIGDIHIWNCSDNFTQTQTMNIFQSNPRLDLTPNTLTRAIFQSASLLTAHKNGFLCQFDLPNHAAIIHCSKIHMDSITTLLLGPQSHILSSSIDETITVYDPTERAILQVINLGQSIQKMTYSIPNQSIYCAVDFNNIIEITYSENSKDGECNYTVKGCYNVGEEKVITNIFVTDKSLYFVDELWLVYYFGLEKFEILEDGEELDGVYGKIFLGFPGNFWDPVLAQDLPELAEFTKSGKLPVKKITEFGKSAAPPSK
jgi:hypothetical protein